MKKPGFLLFLLLLIYLVAGVSSINAISITWDEAAHFAFGVKTIKGNPERSNIEKDNSKMPVSVLNVLPRVAEQIFHKNLQRNDGGVADIVHGRYITLLFSILTILLVYKWAGKLYGEWAGLFSAFLFAFCPNNQSNAVLVTTDTYSVFFLLATMYSLWKYCNERSTKNFIAFALLLALSQLVKQSLFHLYVLAPLCLVVYSFVKKAQWNAKKILINVLLAAAISWIVINAGFAFYKINNRLGDFHFISHFFQSIQQLLPVGFPVPVSASFVDGLDQAKYYDQLGGGFSYSSFGAVNILGKSVTGGALWYYYFVSLLFKTPVACLIFIGWSLYLLARKLRIHSFISNEFFLLAPVLYFILLMSFLYKTQCGIRHIIFVYPLLYIFCGSIIPHIKTVAQKIVLSLLCGFLIVGLVPYWNNYYAYTNELIIHKKNAFRTVGNSNLNFNQADNYLQQYLKDNPGVKYAPLTSQSGKFIISVDDYMNVWNTGNYKWLQRYTPSGHVAYCYLYFDIPVIDAKP